MGINIRAKGQTGEREIADLLNGVLFKVYGEHGMALDSTAQVQRNQLQTAVGGDDLTNTLHFSIEIKRQEALQVNTWWKQAVASANRQGKLPVLLYRQNRKAWQCVLMGTATRSLDGSRGVATRMTVELDTFLMMFELEARRALDEQLGA